MCLAVDTPKVLHAPLALHNVHVSSFGHPDSHFTENNGKLGWEPGNEVMLVTCKPWCRLGVYIIIIYSPFNLLLW